MEPLSYQRLEPTKAGFFSVQSGLFLKEENLYMFQSVLLRKVGQFSEKW